MIKYIFVSTLMLLTCWTQAVQADNTQTITLKDGSQIKGELISIASGVYTVHTPTMGDIKISSSQVVNITNAQAMPVSAMPPAANPSSSDNGLNQKIQTAQSRLMADPQMITEIQELMKDPELMQLLTDPSLTQAVLSHDVKSIQNNPKAQALMNNPKMRALMDQMRQQNYTQ